MLHTARSTLEVKEVKESIIVFNEHILLLIPESIKVCIETMCQDVVLDSVLREVQVVAT